MDAITTHLSFAQQWDIGEPIGSGGFGKVYAATGPHGARAVAKFVPKAPGAERELLFADLHDVRNVVPVIDSGDLGDYWVLIMPRADTSLRDVLDGAGGALELETCVAVLADVAAALADLLGRVVHRDLKPANTLLLEGRWCLADFGISRYAEASTAPDTKKHALTAAYAAPERWRFERATSACDIYAFGVMAYEMLAGHLPFPGPAMEDYRAQHLQAEPPQLADVPSGLATIVAECLYKAPEARPSPRLLETRLQRASDLARVGGRRRLGEANRAEVSRRSAASREESESKAEFERRALLVKAATDSLSTISDEIRDVILSEASAAVERPRGTAGSCIRLGDAELRLRGLRPPDEAGRAAISRYFDVIAYSSLAVHIPSDPYGYEGRSHSLWFCDAQKAGEYLWFETAFMFSPLLPRLAPQDPFSLEPGIEARSAIGTGVGELMVAWPFTPLVIGDLDEFIDRWCTWFADAADGRLMHPSSMPERNPEGSWRRQ